LGLHPEPEIMVGHQTFSDHFYQMSDQLSGIMSDHLKTPDHRYSALKTPKSCALSINMFTVGLVGFRFHYIFVICKMKL